jgi:hypothetical protein
MSYLNDILFAQHVEVTHKKPKLKNRNRKWYQQRESKRHMLSLMKICLRVRGRASRVTNRLQQLNMIAEISNERFDD